MAAAAPCWLLPSWRLGPGRVVWGQSVCSSVIASCAQGSCGICNDLVQCAPLLCRFHGAVVPTMCLCSRSALVVVVVRWALTKWLLLTLTVVATDPFCACPPMLTADQACCGVALPCSLVDLDRLTRCVHQAPQALSHDTSIHSRCCACCPWLLLPCSKGPSTLLWLHHTAQLHGAQPGHTQGMPLSAAPRVAQAAAAACAGVASQLGPSSACLLQAVTMLHACMCMAGAVALAPAIIWWWRSRAGHWGQWPWLCRLFSRGQQALSMERG